MRYLAAIDKKRNRIFVLAVPHLCAVKMKGMWYYSEPLSDEEIANYDLVTDLELAKKLADEAKEALQI